MKRTLKILDTVTGVGTILVMMSFVVAILIGAYQLADSAVAIWRSGHILKGVGVMLCSVGLGVATILIAAAGLHFVLWCRQQD